MRLLIFLIIFIFKPAFGETIEPKPHELRVPYFNIIYRLGGISAVTGASPQYTVLANMFLFEGMIPFKNPRAYFYTQFRVVVPGTYSQGSISKLRPIINMENIRLGALLGFGGVVVDKRDIIGRGIIFMINGGIVLDAGVDHIFNKISSIYANSRYNDPFLNLGFEINLRTLFNYHKHHSIIFGLDFGYLYAINSGDPFYNSDMSSFSSYNTLTYGLSLGFNF